METGWGAVGQTRFLCKPIAPRRYARDEQTSRLELDVSHPHNHDSFSATCFSPGHEHQVSVGGARTRLRSKVGDGDDGRDARALAQPLEHLH